jgi:hypothetical protein
MSTPAQTSRPSRFSFGRFLLGALFTLLLLGAGWLYFAWNWSYSQGERAGWVQKFSEKGWLCKTWEGEVALVSMPGAIPEKFEFTVMNDEVAKEINRFIGRRVSMHYEQKVGLPTTCFGETRHYVTRVSLVDDGANPQGIPNAGGVSMPVPVPQPMPGQPSMQGQQPMPVQPQMQGQQPMPVQPQMQVQQPGQQQVQPQMPVQPAAPVQATPGLPSVPAPMPAPVPMQQGAPVPAPVAPAPPAVAPNR